MSMSTSLERLSSAEKKTQDGLEVQPSDTIQDLEQFETPIVYKLYKRRWFGIITLVSIEDEAP